MCDVSGCSSEIGSVSDDGRDAMLDILDEFQRLYQGRMARLERDPTAPSYSKDKMELLEDWIGDLNQQNRTLVETVKELETEASQRCEMLESRLVSTTSSTKQYMLQLHQLQRQVQQLMAGRLQAETRAGEMTSLVDQLTAENEQLRRRLEPSGDALQSAAGADRGRHCASGAAPSGVSSNGGTQPAADETGHDVTSHVQRLKADLRVALRDKEDLQEILDIRKCELEESQTEVASLRAELDRLKTASGAAAGTGTARHKLEPPAEVHRLQKHCRDLVDQRNQALAELAKVKVRLMEVMEEQVEDREEVEPAPEEPLASDSDVISEYDVTKPYQQSNGHVPQMQRSAFRQQLANQSASRLENELEERSQLIAALQGHLASARNEVTLKDETLARLESKLDAARQELSDVTERLAMADGERAALGKQNEMLNKQVSDLQRRADEATSVAYRLEGEADQQMAQITDLQERLLAAETSNKELTSKCVQKDVEIGRQWTTISSLQEALLEAKQQVEALQPGRSLFGGLLGGGGTRKHTEEIKKLKMDLAVAKSQFKESFNESAKQETALEELREENRKLGQTVTQLRSQVTTLEAMAQIKPETGGEEGADVALVEAMFERLQTELCVLADTLGQGQGHSPGQGQELNMAVMPADQGTQTEGELETDEQEDWAAVGCCEHQLQLTQQRDVNEYLRRLLRKRAVGAPDLTPSLEREVTQLTEENRLWRQRVTQGQRQLADLRHSLTSLRDGVEECKKEETKVSELRQQLQEARRQLQLQASISDQLVQVRSQVDLLILEKQHQQAMIRELRSDLTASGDEATAAQELCRVRQEQASQLTSQLTQERDNSHQLSQQVRQLTADHADCVEQRGRLEARLAEAHAQLAETLCGQDEVHSQADVIVEHVTAWLAEWRAENQRLTRRVDQQAETIAALQMENRHLSDRLTLLSTPSPASLPPGRPPSLHKAAPPAPEPRPGCPHSRRTLFTAVEGYPHSLTDRYPGSFTEGCVPGAPPNAGEQGRHSLSEGCPPPPPHRGTMAGEFAPPPPHRGTMGGEFTPPPPHRGTMGGEFVPPPPHRGPMGGEFVPPLPYHRPSADGFPSLARAAGHIGCTECAASQGAPSSMPAGCSGRAPVTPGTPSSVDHVPTRDSDIAWPGHIFNMVADMHDRRRPSWRPHQTEQGGPG